MLRLNYFFEGMLKKEEAASAFLAMALQGVPSFRAHFLRQLGLSANRLSDLVGQQWRDPEVEDKHRVDVRMASDRCVMLIENKIQYGSKLPGQLRRYYRKEREQPHQLPIIAVYLSPARMGTDEVEKVLTCKEYLANRTGDVAVLVAWETVTSYSPAYPDADERFVAHALAAIQAAIDGGNRAIYFGEGERAKLRELFEEVEQRASEGLRSVPHELWHKEDEYLETKRTTIMAGVKTRLESVSRSSPTVSGVVLDDVFHLPMVATFRLHTEVKKTSPAGDWWKRCMQRPEYEVPGIGTFVREDSGFYRYEFHMTGKQEAIAPRIADIMVRAVEVIGSLLKTQQYPLLLDDLPEGWRRKNRRRGWLETGDAR